MVSNNNGYSSVGRVSEQVGSEGFGCHYRYRGTSGWYDGATLPVDFAKIAEGMGAIGIHADSKDQLADAIAFAKKADRTVVIETATDWHERVPGYGFWWTWRRRTFPKCRRSTPHGNVTKLKRKPSAI